MAINPAGFQATRIEDAESVCVRMLSSAPTPLQKLDESVSPNEVVGFFNTNTGYVELFVSSVDGTFYYKLQ
jgi:hypothetical protein